VRPAPRRSWPRRYRGAQGGLVDPELGDDVPGDLDDRDPLQVLGMQPVVGLDVDFLELERVARVAEGEDQLARLVAEVAAVARVEGYARASQLRYSG
jgi:hypothetical protein